MALDTSETMTTDTFGDELLPGTTLFHGQYRITRFINSGGFGITYLAKDSLDRDVVIKECFSSTFCRRTTRGSASRWSKACRRNGLPTTISTFCRAH